MILHYSTYDPIRWLEKDGLSRRQHKNTSKTKQKENVLPKAIVQSPAEYTIRNPFPGASARVYQYLVI
jgi:hypothetical protein